MARQCSAAVYPLQKREETEEWSKRAQWSKVNQRLAIWAQVEIWKPIPEKHAASSLSQWGFMLFEDVDKSFQGGLHLLPRIRNLDRPRISYSCLICQQPYCCCKHLNLLLLLPLLPSSLPFSKNKQQNLRPFSGLIPAPLPSTSGPQTSSLLQISLSLSLCLSLSSPPAQPTMWKQILQQIQTQILQPRILNSNLECFSGPSYYNFLSAFETQKGGAW